MTTERQIDANRSNAGLSTGPPTSAGKEASKCSALKHGLRAEAAIIPGEDSGAYHEFRQALVTELAPVGELEALLVDRIVSLASRLQRTGRVEAGLFVRGHFQAVAERARSEASEHEEVRNDPFEGMMGTRSVTNEEAHSAALREAAAAEAMRDADSTVPAAAFERDSSDVFPKLARYETSIERSLYRALQELHRLQGARTEGKLPAPIAAGPNVERGQTAA